VAERYNLPVAQAEEDVRNLVTDLLKEHLIEIGDGAPASVEPIAGSAENYEPPKLVRYDDMSDMFALDPPLPELPDVSRHDHP
jgi:hypothetical protein